MDPNPEMFCYVQDQLFKTVTNMVQADFSYPLESKCAASASIQRLRQDRLVEKATDTLSLTYDVPNTNNYTIH